MQDEMVLAQDCHLWTIQMPQQAEISCAVSCCLLTALSHQCMCTVNKLFGGIEY